MVGVFGEHSVNPPDPEAQFRVIAKTEQNHTRVRLAKTHDEFAEVEVRGYDDPIVRVSNRENARVGQPFWILQANPDGIVPKAL